MWRTLKRIFSRPSPAAPLAGAPVRPRVKTYSADSGYVFLHCYLGYRSSERPDAGTEHLFQISSQGRPAETVCIFAPDHVLQSLGGIVGRTVSPRERYALVKIALFALLDRSTPASLPTHETLSAEEAAAIWETLGL